MIRGKSSPDRSKEVEFSEYPPTLVGGALGAIKMCLGSIDHL